MSDDEQGKGIRGDELADDAAARPGTVPDPDELAEGGIRGDGLAEGATPATTSIDPDDAAEDGIRGNGLAEDA
jgi:hypothetical protein